MSLVYNIVEVTEHGNRANDDLVVEDIEDTVTTVTVTTVDDGLGTEHFQTSFSLGSTLL